MPSARKTAVLKGTPGNLLRLARALRRGELVAVPTETVYGLAGNALDPAAVRRIFRAKGRPANDPLIIHLHSLTQLGALAAPNAAVEKVARAFWPGPLTLVLPKTDAVPDLVTSGLPSVAIRMPSHPTFRKLLRACGLPLAAPSANPFGYVSPTSAAHVLDGLGGKIRYILDGGSCRIGLESTILDLRTPGRPVILRPGAIERQAIEAVLGVPVRLAAAGKKPARRAALAPGMLSRHYSPHTPVRLHTALPQPIATGKSVGRRREAFLFLRRPAALAKGRAPAHVFWLSKDGDLAEAARSLFARLRALDGGGWSLIHAEKAPGTSALALAINDRLKRAAAKR